MTILDLKNSIEQGVLPHQTIIFTYTDTDWVCMQYAREISKRTSREILFVDNAFSTNSEWSDDKLLYVLRIDTLTEDVSSIKNLIVFCKKVECEQKDALVVEVPPLEDWQKDDYACSICAGLTLKDAEILYDTYKYSMYRLDNEVSKIGIFAEQFQPTLFQRMLREGQFDDVSNKTVFDLTTAILQKDISKISYVLKRIDTIDVEPIGLLTILFNNFRNVILVQLNKYPTADLCNMTSGQFYAVKKNNINYYTKEQLVRIFMFLSSVDYKLKSGELSSDYLIDYMLIKIAKLGEFA